MDDNIEVITISQQAYLFNGLHSFSACKHWNVYHSLKPFFFFLIKAKVCQSLGLLQWNYCLHQKVTQKVGFTPRVTDQPNSRLDLKVLSSSLFVGIFYNIINVPNCAGLSLKHRVMHSFSSQRYLEKSVFVLGNYSDRKQIKIRVVYQFCCSYHVSG